jgi:plasmid stabilization system protein ParE
MSLILKRSDYFWEDLAKRVDWYRDRANTQVAEKFIDAIEVTLTRLTQTPGLGRPRFADWPELVGMRSWRVRQAFQRVLIFYRFDAEVLLPSA